MEFDASATVIMCSAIGTESNIIEALKIGAKDFIVKPNLNCLVNILEKLDRNKN